MQDLENRNLGYIRLSRNLINDKLYTDSEYLHIFIHIMLNVNFKDKLANGVVVKKNQFKTGRLSLAKQTGVGESKVERILTFLEENNYIKQQKTNKYRLITITCKDYTLISEQQSTTEQQQSNNRATTKNTTNKDKESKEVKLSLEDFNSIYKTYNPKCRVIPEKDSLSYKRTLKVVNTLGGVSEVIRQIQGYLKYLKVETWRSKKGYDAWFNNPELYGFEWNNKTKQDIPETMKKLLEAENG